ncbi:qua-1 protein, partial [Aphelenchoides avenae]
SAGGAHVPDVGDEEGSGANGESTEAGSGSGDGAETPEDYEDPLGGVDGDGVGGDDINSVAPADGGAVSAKLGGPPPARKHVAAPKPQPRTVGAANQNKARPPARVLGSRTRVAAPQRASPEISDPSDLQFAPENTGRAAADDDPAAPATGAGGGGGGGDASRNCFSGDTLVRTASGDKLMKDLEVGDMVLVPATENMLKYERVEMFYHREPNTVVKFVRIETESGKALSLTPLHLLPFGDCEEMASSDFDLEGVQEWMRRSRFARKASVGECVLTIGPQDKVIVDRITKVGRTYSKGIYSPMTVEGAIVTNNVLASCFSQIESHAVQKLAFDFLVMFYNAFGYMSGLATEVQEIPSMLDYVHRLSWYVVPFATY